jgi:hypothetical protein
MAIPARLAFAVGVAIPLLVGVGIAPAYIDPGVDQIDDLLESPGGGGPARGGIQMPGVQVFGPQYPVPPVEAFPGVTGIPVPGICVPGMPCPVIPMPQIDIDYGSPAITPGH